MLLVFSFFALEAHKLKTIDAKSIVSQIKKGKPVNLENAEIIGDIDFSKINYFKETDHNARAYIDSPLFFKKCKFRGKLIGFSENKGFKVSTTFTKNVSFLDCIFLQNIELNSSIVASICSFSGSQIFGEIHMQNAFFDKPVFFNKTIFVKDSHFQNIRCGSSFDFSESIFNQNASFQGSSFFGMLNFRMTEFREGLDFTLCSFFSVASFNFSSIKTKGLFNNSHFRSRLEFENVKSSSLDMEECAFDADVLFNELDLEKFSINSCIFIKGKPSFNFKNTKPSLFSFENVKFLNNNILEVK